MGRFNFASPFAAAGDALTQLLLERKAEERQRMLDEITQRNSDSMIADREMNRKIQMEHIEALRGQRDALEDERRSGLAGDVAGVLTPQQEIDSDTSGVLKRGGLSGLIMGRPATVQDVENAPQTPITPDLQPGAALPSERFRGTAEQVKEQDDRKRQDDYLKTLDPESEEARALRYESMTGRNAPTGMFDQRRNKPSMVGEYEYYVEQEKAAGRQPKSFDSYQTEDANRRAPRPAPPVVIMTPTGPQLVDRNEGTASPVVDGDGKQVPLLPTATERDRGAGYKRMEPVMASIDELSERINTQQGLLATMAGGAAKVAAQANYNDDVAEYESLISGFTPLVARAVGHVGVLTEQDVQSVRALFPAPRDSKTLRDRKIARIRKIMGALSPDTEIAPDTAAAAAPGVDTEFDFVPGKGLIPRTR